MQKIRCAVVGVGYLGRFHAQKYKMLPEVELVAVCDVKSEVCESVARELGVAAYSDHRELFGKIDAVSIAATTNQHYQITKDFLMQGIHVLLEKPMTETVQQADELIELAELNNVIFQIGHLERFNAARLALDKHLEQPLFIESQRLAPFNPRGADVNVVLDLMIHDIDIIQTIANSPIKSIDAHGAPVLSKSIDIANARITFENHCVANVTASRVSYKTERKTRIFQKDSYISIDYQNKQFAVFQKGNGEIFPGIPDVARYEATFENGDALFEEIKSFIHSVMHNEPPLVSAREGRDALATADKISALILHNLAIRHAQYA